MKNKGLFSVAIAIAVGILILLGYFVDWPLLLALRVTFVQWAILLTALAVFIGVINLMVVHMDRISKGKGGVSSLALLLGLLSSLGVGLVFGPQHPFTQAFFDAIVLPGEASLLAVLSVSLLYAAIRLLHRRTDLVSLIFVATLILVLLGMAPMPFGEIPVLGDMLRPYITQVLAAAGARGILLGVALGVLTAGLRILMGVDRPYGGRR